MSPDDVPRRVLLFSGHIVDAPGRRPPRFPAANVEPARAAIAAVLSEWGAARADLALCGGAAGGDLLFAEVAAGLGARLELLLPLATERFLAVSVAPSGPSWVERFERLVAGHGVVVRNAPADLGALADRPFEYANRWLLERALTWGPEAVRMLALWDGRPGDGAGGTADMVAAVEAAGCPVRIVDPARPA